MSRKSAVAVVGASSFLLLIFACSSDSSSPAGPTGASSDSSSTTSGGSGARGSTGTPDGPSGSSTTMGAAASGVGGATTGATGQTSVDGTTSSGGLATGDTNSTSSATSAGGTLVGMGGGSSGGGANAGDPLDERLHVSTSTTPEGVQEGVRNWRIWDRGDLVVAPVFTVPLANCGTLVGYTTEAGGVLTPRVAYLDDSDALVTTVDLTSGFECRGLAAEPDGNFAALLWDDDADEIFVARYDVSGALRGDPTPLVNSDNSPTDFGIGESRLEYGDGRYGAYYHVHSDSGHEGDTLKWVDAASGAESTEWSWGCSHSMSNLLRFHPSLGQFLPVCVTDCYPGTGSGDFAEVSIGGIYLNHQESKVMDVDAGCNGSVAGELGGAALAPAGFQLVFNAHQAPTTLGQNSYDEDSMNQDIGFATIQANLASSDVVWLTNTPDIDEADSSIARWEPAEDNTEQYVVGWSEPGANTGYQLARVDASGSILEGPVNVTGLAHWGRRDDPFRQHVNKDVVWAWFDSAGSTTLNFARLSSGASATCASF